MKRIVVASLILLASCAAVMKEQYKVDLESCLSQGKAHNWPRAQVDLCIKGVQVEWDEAGAPPAAIKDGGAE